MTLSLRPFLILSFPGSFDSRQVQTFYESYLSQINFFWQSSVISTKEVTLPLLKLFYNCLIKKCLHIYVLARGLKVWCFGHRYIIYCSNRGEKNTLETLAEHSAFEKVPLARNQQGAVKSLVAKSSEDPDHMGCTLFQSVRR